MMRNHGILVSYNKLNHKYNKKRLNAFFIISKTTIRGGFFLQNIKTTWFLSFFSLSSFRSIPIMGTIESSMLCYQSANPEFFFLQKNRIYFFL